MTVEVSSLKNNWLWRYRIRMAAKKKSDNFVVSELLFQFFLVAANVVKIHISGIFIEIKH